MRSPHSSLSWEHTLHQMLVYNAALWCVCVCTIHTHTRTLSLSLSLQNTYDDQGIVYCSFSFIVLFQKQVELRSIHLKVGTNRHVYTCEHGCVHILHINTAGVCRESLCTNVHTYTCILSPRSRITSSDEDHLLRRRAQRRRTQQPVACAMKTSCWRPVLVPFGLILWHMARQERLLREMMRVLTQTWYVCVYICYR